MSHPLLNTHLISKSISGRVLFEEISLSVFPMERVALVGRNGVGKSTLLKILSGLTSWDEGKVTLTKGTRVSYLEQSPQFKTGETLTSALLENPDIEDHTKVYEWLNKLDLNDLDFNQEIRSFSGGWQKRIALAREFIKAPDLLILDEPTNHLDLKTIQWLEEVLISQQLSLLFVSHDRYFINHLATRVLDLDPRLPQSLLNSEGDYTKYLETKASVLFDLRSTHQKLTNTLRREKEWLSRGPQARLTKQQARIDSAYELEKNVENLKAATQEKTAGIQFVGQDRRPQRLIQAENITKSFGGKCLFKDLNLVINSQTRLAILGDNGIGKTTLIRSLIGEIPVDSGLIKTYEEIKIGYFEQFRSNLDPQKSLIHNLCPEGDYVKFRNQFIHIRSYLEKFLFERGQFDLPVHRLSGGEQARLRFAQIMLESLHILILDEPTNDLDIETQHVLSEALAEYPSAVLLVSHDRQFINETCDKILFLSKKNEKENELLSFTGIEQLEAWQKTQKTQDFKATQLNKERAEGADSKRLSYKEKVEFEKMESTIHEKEFKLAEFETQLLQPEISSNAGKSLEIFQKTVKLKAEIEKLYARWAELESRQK